MTHSRFHHPRPKRVRATNKRSDLSCIVAPCPSPSLQRRRDWTSQDCRGLRQRHAPRDRVPGGGLRPPTHLHPVLARSHRSPRPSFTLSRHTSCVTLASLSNPAILASRPELPVQLRRKTPLSPDLLLLPLTVRRSALLSESPPLASCAACNSVQQAPAPPPCPHRRSSPPLRAHRLPAALVPLPHVLCPPCLLLRASCHRSRSISDAISQRSRRHDMSALASLRRPSHARTHLNAKLHSHEMVLMTDGRRASPHKRFSHGESKDVACRGNFIATLHMHSRR